jgi:DNA-binding MarR family transcriptional regulator
LSETKKQYRLGSRAARVDRVVAGQDTLMHVLAAGHATEFLEIDITMPQAKTLYLVAAAGQIRMSELSARLGVSLSTVSGLVERLVEHELVSRHDDPADRRQVLVSVTAAGSHLTDRFREMNGRQFRTVLDGLADADLAVIEEAITILVRAVDRIAGSGGESAQPGAPSLASRPSDRSPRTPSPSPAMSPSRERNPA